MFLRYLLIFLLVYFGLRLFMRYVVPLLLATFVRKAQKNMRQKFEEHQQQRQAENFKEGEVFISKKGDKKRNSDNNDGEYIDFEEVKE